jgi:hypothetical protein
MKRLTKNFETDEWVSKVNTLLIIAENNQFLDIINNSKQEFIV